MIVFFMEITSFLLDFIVLSVRFLTSEEKWVDRSFLVRDFVNQMN